MFAAVSLVGTADDDGLVTQAADETIAAPSAPEPTIEPVSQSTEPFGMADDVAFASDEDLIDDAEGFDPMPMSDTPDPVLLDAGPASDDLVEMVAKPGAGDTLPVDERRYEILE
ncbi:hypothetical protein G7A66_11530 [Altererythrobacter sp. SALINAS58]|uniref:hypothetical protein n=1 Tax=Alteripontixanthobacter muriae TaxID=2705546 RepID=UPI0019D6306B|nr:hypothetical protein [Alteripontixanthobacter muriae]NTZ43702.1 hypothetical protein [Alteripontixanthobacter muriae]